MIDHLLFSDTAEALGWTLLNSIWQGLLIFFVLVILLRFVPLQRASLRYGLACLALVTMLAAVTFTFIYLLPSQAVVVEIAVHLTSDSVEESVFLPTIAHDTRSTIDAIMPWIVVLWLGGVAIFAFRLLGAWWYLSKLRSDAIVLGDEWHKLLQTLAGRMALHRPVALAESLRVHAPIVIGYLKPVILLPAGMLSGLTTEQVETVLLHELAHIRRHDFLVNVVQSVVEVILFFNPFVWLISSAIRREREFCCDDMVLCHNKNSFAYARALAALEEARLEKPALVLSLAANKNQLLYRIRRIMEKSSVNYSMRDRLVPAVLLIIGLVCASWLTLGSEVGQEKDVQDIVNEQSVADGEGGVLQPADTTDKKKSKSAFYSRKSIITYDDKGEPHEEVIEEFHGDDELKAMMEDFDMDMTIPPFPPMANFPMAPFPPSFPDAWFDLALPFGNFDLMIDSLPPGPGGRRDWDAFRKEFEERFQKRFGDFYQSHEEDLEKMLDEMEETFEHQQGSVFDQRFLEEMRVVQEEMEQVRRRMQTEWEESLQRDLELAQRSAESATAMELGEHMREVEQEMRRAQQAMERAGRANESVTSNFKRFREELAAQLLSDNYLEKGEGIESLQWDEDGDLIVNGKKIKDADREKYDKIRSKYLGRGNFRYVE